MQGYRAARDRLKEAVYGPEDSSDLLPPGNFPVVVVLPDGTSVKGHVEPPEYKEDPRYLLTVITESEGLGSFLEGMWRVDWETAKEKDTG